MGSIKPLDGEFLAQRVKEGYRHWVTLEEHHQVGGLGSTVLEWLSDKKNNSIQMTRLGIGDHFIHKLGNQTFVRKSERLDADAIVKLIESLR